MASDYFPFSYTAQHTRDHCLRVVEEIAAKFGLLPDGASEEVVPARSLTEADWDALARELWPDDIELTALHEEGLHPPDKELADQFGRAVVFQHRVWRSVVDGTVLDAKFSAKNDCAVIGAWIWLEKKMVFVAGFIAIKSRDKVALRSISEEIRRALDVPLRIDDSWR